MRASPHRQSGSSAEPRGPIASATPGAVLWLSGLGCYKNEPLEDTSVGLKPWPQDMYRKVTSYATASQSQETTGPEVTDRTICVAEAASSPPLCLPSASLLGLLLVAAAAYIRSEADGSSRTLPQAQELGMCHPLPACRSLAHHPSRSSQQQPGSKEPVGGGEGASTEKGVL